MLKVVIVDSGPLVAFFNRTDRFHQWAKVKWEGIAPPLLTCEAVLAETCFLLRHLPGGSRAVLELVNRGVIQTPFQLEDEVQSIMSLMSRYSDVPMSLADACLVRMAEQHAQSRVLTLDGDFLIYRKSNRRVVPVLIPG
ncbi:MAG: PIN domain-containing protein [Acidobacteria bacterium]|nr:PIN domain-containing protein [Acidobacteriota bacterium]